MLTTIQGAGNGVGNLNGNGNDNTFGKSVTVIGKELYDWG